jgi:hypothetical protein
MGGSPWLKNLIEALFESFRQRLGPQGFITRKGQIVHASFVEVPRQHNRGKEKRNYQNRGSSGKLAENPSA